MHGNRKQEKGEMEYREGNVVCTRDHKNIESLTKVVFFMY